MESLHLEQQLRTLPVNPGVYLFKDYKSKIIYIGKAANLNNRVRNYFTTIDKLPTKTRHMITRIRDIDFMVTGTEQEALILENNLIKKYQPHYNIRLKDSKTFPYLKISLNEDWPRIYITRRLCEDGARYFGPFTSAGSVRRTLSLIKKIFPFRSCSKAISGKDKHPCLSYHIHRCPGPCIGAISKEDYRKLINQIIMFLEGKHNMVIKELTHKMLQASNQNQFEKAALLRDQINSIEKVLEGEKIAISLRENQDVVALSRDTEHALVDIFLIRGNKIIGRNQFLMEGIHEEEETQIMTSFVEQYYTATSYIPSLILLQQPIDDISIISEWLKKAKRGNVKIQVPQRGTEKKLVEMVAEDARKSLLLAKAKQLHRQDTLLALQELQDRLQLPRTPLRIECYDISNTQGALAVGSMIVLEKGLPKPALYRRFRIKTITVIDDCAMIRETLYRRFKRNSGSWAIMPDLVLIDGGIGQLNAALETREEMGLNFLPLASLAKKHEEVFIPAHAEAIHIPADSPALHILQRARDEAHRFAISYHKNLRSKENLISALDSIYGIGPQSKKSLLRHFGSIKAIRDASTEEISQTEGITVSLAQRVKEQLCK